MKIKVIGRVTKNAHDVWQMSIVIGKGALARTVQLDLDSGYDPACPDLTRLFGEEPTQTDGLWQYRGTVVDVQGGAGVSADEFQLKIKHVVARHDKSFERMRREVEAFENMSRAEGARRESIPDAVRLFVWQRDQGKCVRCGSSERLEFDHIIPVVKGGSNTERNIQLLCEQCNRVKGATI